MHLNLVRKVGGRVHSFLHQDPAVSKRVERRNWRKGPTAGPEERAQDCWKRPWDQWKGTLTGKQFKLVKWVFYGFLHQGTLKFPRWQEGARWQACREGPSVPSGPRALRLVGRALGPEWGSNIKWTNESFKIICTGPWHFLYGRKGSCCGSGGNGLLHHQRKGFLGPEQRSSLNWSAGSLLVFCIGSLMFPKWQDRKGAWCRTRGMCLLQNYNIVSPCTTGGKGHETGGNRLPPPPPGLYMGKQFKLAKWALHGFLH